MKNLSIALVLYSLTQVTVAGLPAPGGAEPGYRFDVRPRWPLADLAT